MAVRFVIGPLLDAIAWSVAWLAAQRRSIQIAVLGFAALAVLWIVTGDRDPEAVYVESETEALARVLRSEIGTGSWQQRVHVAWATRNLAASRGQSIVEMACSPCGPQERGRPVASRQAATDTDRKLAALILAADPALDPTGGANHFINPALQDALARRGVPGYRNRPYARVRKIWIDRYGWEPYYRLGPDLELWGPRRR